MTISKTCIHNITPLTNCKVCVNKQVRDWQLRPENIERVREIRRKAQRKYYAANRDAVNARRRAAKKATGD